MSAHTQDAGDHSTSFTPGHQTAGEHPVDPDPGWTMEQFLRECTDQGSHLGDTEERLWRAYRGWMAGWGVTPLSAPPG